MRARTIDTTASLAGTWFGSRLPAAARERLAPHLTVVEYDAGTEILREGEPMRSLGIVLTGRVALRLRVPERGPTTILTVEPGDVIGWSAVIAPHRATDTAVALLPTELVLIDGAALRAELAADAELAAPVYLSLLEALARRLTGTRLQLLDLFTMTESEPW
jgi:CRP-like cAMP-binding protein